MNTDRRSPSWWFPFALTDTPRRFRVAAAVIVLTSIGACSSGSGTTDPPDDDHPVPTLTSLEPSSAEEGSGAFTLTVRGNSFVKQSRVRWNGSARTTTYVSATELTASIPGSDVASEGTSDVTVFNPAQGGGESSARTFTISAPDVASVTVEPTSGALFPGQTLQLEATPLSAGDTPLTDRGVTWTTEDDEVATVDETGLVAAVAEGTTTITAESEGVEGDAEITVLAGSLIGPEGGMAAGGDVTLTFPQGAVASPVGVTIDENVSPPDGAGLVPGTAWDLGPSGTDFDQPVTVEIFYDSNDLPADVTPANLVLHRWDGSSWQPLGNQTVNVGEETVSGTTTEFSPFALLEREFTSVMNGGGHVCTLVTGGRAYCWGEGAEGKLGNGSTDNQVEAGPVVGDFTFSQISPGFDHTCALTTSSLVACWGAGDSGQLGRGTYGDRTTPDLVSGGRVFASVSAGFDHTCALTPAGDGWCWGNNQAGQMGNGTTASSADTGPNAPVMVGGDHTFTQLDAGGYHNCALDSDGQAWCWGWNADGQLGDGTSFIQRTMPVAVSGGHTFTTISAGGYHTCALDQAGSAWCWGWAEEGQIGHGQSPVAVLAPTQVAGGHTFTQISAGSQHTCALTEPGQIWCWGNGDLGALGLGDPSETDHDTPQKVGSQLFLAEAISAGDSHTCALRPDGSTWCWGWSWATGSGGGGHVLAPRLMNRPDFGAVASGPAPIATSSAVPEEKPRRR